MKDVRLYQVLQSTVMTEKAVQKEAHAEYVFTVSPDATKHDVAMAVERVFGVRVMRVNILNVKGKTKMRGRRPGRRADRRKAYVRLMEGETIRITSEQPST